MSRNSDVTGLGVVKYNAQRDVVDAQRRRRLTSTSGVVAGVFVGTNVNRDDDVFTIMPRELCLRWRTPHTKKRMYTDTDMNVFSSANGVYLTATDLVDPKPAPTGLVEEAQCLRDYLDFGGVAVTSAAYSSTGASDDQLVVLFGGTTTMRNTGHDPILCGDYVQWDLPVLKAPQGDGPNATLVQPPPRSKDCSKHKLLFQTRPFRIDQCRVHAEDLVGLVLGDEAEENARRLTPILHRRFCHERRRIFGRALSSAQPGHEFDLLLGRYMA